MTGPPIEVHGLLRTFGDRVALRGIDLSVEAGQIVGLAGPNGSGKTTLLRILAGLLRADSGRVRVFGRDPWRARAEVARSTRFAFAPPALYEDLTAREHVRLLGGVGTSRPATLEVDAALECVGLLDRSNERVRSFSFGMRQRLALAQALVPVPELLVLDEPTDGLDPLAVLELRAVLADLRRERGVAILLSSHLLLELDELVDELIVLDEGETLFSGPPRDLAGEERVLLAVDDPRRAAELLEGAGHSLEYHVERPSLERALLARLAQRRKGSGGDADRSQL